MPSPGQIKVPKLNASFFTSNNPKYKLDSVETIRLRTKSRRKQNKSMREDVEKSSVSRYSNYYFLVIETTDI
jgi:single-stranded DNA-specific DHH superfamily exonuclease